MNYLSGFYPSDFGWEVTKLWIDNRRFGQIDVTFKKGDYEIEILFPTRGSEVTLAVWHGDHPYLDAEDVARILGIDEGEMAKDASLGGGVSMPLCDLHPLFQEVGKELDDPKK